MGQGKKVRPESGLWRADPMGKVERPKRQGSSDMHRPTRALFALVLPLIVLIVLATSAAAHGNANKVDVCHWAGGRFHEIRVSANALPAHLAHGDVLPDEYGDCPGDDDQDGDHDGDHDGDNKGHDDDHEGDNKGHDDDHEGDHDGGNKGQDGDHDGGQRGNGHDGGNKHDD
jgi:hypothetical protein